MAYVQQEDLEHYRLNIDLCMDVLTVRRSKHTDLRLNIVTLKLSWPYLILIISYYLQIYFIMFCGIKNYDFKFHPE